MPDQAGNSPRAVEVAVPVAQIADVLSYAVPTRWAGSVAAGKRVRVPVGSRQLVGVIVDVDRPRPEGQAVKLRAIDAVLDDEPVVTEAQLALCRFVAEYYLSPIGEVIRLALPPGTTREAAVRYRISERGGAARVFGAAHGLTSTESDVLSRIADGELKTARQLKSADRRLARLVELGLLEAVEAERPQTERLDERVVVRADGEVLPTRAWALGALDAWLRTQPPGVLASEVRVVFPGARGKLARLAALGRIELVPEVRAAEKERGLAATRHAHLTEDQARAVDAIWAVEAGASLLEGVTGSGKTEVYLEVLRRTLDEGRGALLVVPEIALTPQLLSRVRAALDAPEAIAVLHSGLTPAERRDALARLRRGEARIALGARSSLFAPVPDLGLLVVDEEHEPSLKQEETPRYHGRDVALWRARAEGARCVLGSATPSLESRHNAARGKLAHLRLPTRASEGGLPDVEVVDLRARAQMREAKKLDQPASEGPGVVLSNPLVQAMAETLEDGEQVLLFLNRRGYASVLLCDACGEVVECPHCSVSLTLHRRPGAAGRDRLRCHQCDHSQPVPGACPSCRAEGLVALGLGTERVEAEVAARFPSARVVRLDRDTTRRRGALSKVLEQIQRREVDVIVGTQMVAKGHDFPGIALVGVILADVALSIPDFRAAERAFQLLTQVAGRAGRGERRGRVVLQTYQPTHPAIVAAAQHDVEGFLAAELAFREEHTYPPFSRAALCRVSGTDPTAVDSVARRVGEKLRQVAREQLVEGTWDVLGPAPAGIERLRGQTRHQVFVRTERPAARAALLAAVQLDEGIRKALQQTKCRLVLDVDPISVV